MGKEYFVFLHSNVYSASMILCEGELVLIGTQAQVKKFIEEENNQNNVSVEFNSEDLDYNLEYDIFENKHQKSLSRVQQYMKKRAFLRNCDGR